MSAVERVCIVCDDAGCEFCPGTGTVRAALAAMGRDARRERLEQLWNAAQSEHTDARRVLERALSPEARVRWERRVFLYGAMLSTLCDELDELRAATC